MQNIFIELLPPWVETGLQPAFYDKESGTVLQQVSRMWAKMIELGKGFNKLSEDTTTTVNTYIQQFVELYNYVHDYFDNLDVQEEINNKLDDMVEAGTLQEIITTYIQSNVAWTFDSVADMKLATNLVEGSYAQTLGYYSANDGGGALYKITDTGTADERSVIAVDNLYANLVFENSRLNAKQFGAYGDNTHDDTDALNASFTYAYINKLNVFIPEGTYLVSDTLVIYGPNDSSNSGIIIEGADRSLTNIKANDSVTNLIDITPYDTNTAVANIIVRNLTINGNDLTTNGINISGANFTNSRVENLLITHCTVGLSNATSRANVYLSQFIKIRVTNCVTGIQLKNGTNTSLRIADCYIVGGTYAYQIKGNYSTFVNNCADHVTGTVFYFDSYTGTILNPGSESPQATKVFEFVRTNASIINPWTYGNMENAEAIHFYVTTASRVKVIGGKVLIDPSTADTNGEAEGKLYQLSLQSTISFDGTRYSAFKLTNTYHEPDNYLTDNLDNKGAINQRYAGIISYIGRDTERDNGLANANDEESTLKANAIYFGLGDAPRYSQDGYDYRWKRKTVQGDILLSRNVRNIGGIGWVQADDTFAEGASQYWTGGTYLKIPVIMAGSTSDRPTVDLKAGQMYFDTTLNKPIWFKSGSTWVDATGTSV